MRRVIAVLASVAALGGVAVATTGADDDGGGTKYLVELDNAFGLVDGADVKIAGVRAGKITKLTIDRETYRAVVEITVTQEGFGDLRADAFCETRPQSLIGEYFVDCLPGRSEERLPEGGRVPVERTASTIPADLLNNVLRRPYRERLSILLGELGAALTARGEDLNETLRRAVPALRETDRVLEQLAEQRTTIRNLNVNAERVITALARNSDDVVRFVREARDTAEVSANERDALARQFRLLPRFLEELEPTMRLLGDAADDQRPLLQILDANRDRLVRFFEALGPFSEASRPAIRTLASAARAGRPAVRAGAPRIRELRTFAQPLPEIATNLRFVLEHLDDRDNAVERDPRSPGGRGFTGFEAVLRYLWSQPQATNTYDRNTHILKVSAFLNRECAPYADVEAARENPQCNAYLGPNQPGVFQPDTTGDGNPETDEAENGPNAGRPVSTRRRDGGDDDDASAPTGRRVTGGDRPRRGGDRPRRDRLPLEDLPPQVQDLLDELPGIGGGDRGTLDGLGLGEGARSGGSDDSSVLDVLFGL